MQFRKILNTACKRKNNNDVILVLRQIYNMDRRLFIKEALNDLI